ncbi:G-type lectin S-receptor-like serine/threonine-protein kinase LECRK2 [Camellia lanceoleosa]|uniref:G-type lectin S-receptor-like serine/threonine-protein kinase LECRK2 n=1 Tax=Camellia lanceoleosa TaxID=1840588 RepID=A0ACC0IL63_9ERIC|nr:G-type lectin S-receptor-like serine/threonine-protein kinase LECRK2 [Camellia lanceoleosa]
MASSAVFLLLLLVPLFPVVLAISKFDCNVDLTNSTLLAQKDINSSWVSPSGDFAFGFQQAEPSNDGNMLFLLAIWFDKIPDKTIVWSANGVPTREGSKVKLTKDGGLQLFDHQGNVIWTAATNVTGSESSCAAMLDTGNFVVLNGDSNPTWESFKDPHDTILPGQILGTNQKLWSRLSETNYSDGRFQLRMQDDGNLVLYVVSVPYQVNYGAYWAAGISHANSNPQLTFDESGRYIYVKQGNRNVYNFTQKNMGSKQGFYHMARIDFDGVFRLYNHPRRTGAASDGSCSLSWSVVQHIPDDVCSVIQGNLGSGACGYNSYCSVDANGKPECFCPEGYSPMDRLDIQNGCKPNFPLPNCQEDGWEMNPELIEFKELKNTDWPLGDYDLRTGPELDKETCIQFCLDDCFCAAVVYDGNLCYKKKFPLSNGVKTKNLNRTFLMKSSAEFGMENQVQALVDWAYDCYCKRKLDELVKNDEEAISDMKRVERLVMVAIWCTQEDPSIRPSMRKITQMLEGVLEVSVPPRPSIFSAS